MTASPEPPAQRSESGGAAAVQEGGRYPDFFIAGHQKCGTTALYFMLKDHPQIFLPEEKEPRYFAPELRSRLRSRVPRQREYLQSLERYLSLFSEATPEQHVGDASPQYIRSPSAARRIAEVQPDARIIVILREPASFIRSFHLQSVKSAVESQRDLRKAMALEETRRGGRRIPPRCHNVESLEYSRHVRYVEQLERIYEAFPREQVLVLIYDDFRGDNEATVRKVLRFLGVDDTPPVKAIETKKVKAVRSPGLLRATNAVRVARLNPAAAGPLARAVDRLTGPLRGDRFTAIWRSVLYRSPRAPDAQLMLELRRRFKGEVVALSEYLDRDLVSEWGYDAIG